MKKSRFTEEQILGILKQFAGAYDRRQRFHLLPRRARNCSNPSSNVPAVTMAPSTSSTRAPRRSSRPTA